MFSLCNSIYLFIAAAVFIYVNLVMVDRHHFTLRLQHEYDCI